MAICAYTWRISPQHLQYICREYFLPTLRSEGHLVTCRTPSTLRSEEHGPAGRDRRRGAGAHVL